MAYITKTDIEKYMGVTIPSGSDSFIAQVISGCQKYIERVCGSPKFGDRIFQAPAEEDNDAVTRRFNGSGDKKLYVGDLFEAESISVDSESYEIDTDIFLYPLNNTDEAFHWIEMSQPETRLNSSSRSISSDPYIFEQAQANVEIVGYWYFSETPPADIILAMMKLCAGILKESVGDSTVKEIKSEKLGDYDVTFQDVAKVANALGVDSILKPYMMKYDPNTGGGAGSGVIKAS